MRCAADYMKTGFTRTRCRSQQHSTVRYIQHPTPSQFRAHVRGLGRRVYPHCFQGIYPPLPYIVAVTRSTLTPVTSPALLHTRNDVRSRCGAIKENQLAVPCRVTNRRLPSDPNFYSVLGHETGIPRIEVDACPSKWPIESLCWLSTSLRLRGPRRS